MPVCTKCDQEKPLTAFRARKGKGKHGRRTDCYECEALYNRLSGRCHKRQGMTELEFRQMYDNQQGLCACCGIPILIKDCEIDHSHSTNQIRALVCGRCNKAIGY